MNEFKTSSILIVNDIEESLAALLKQLPSHFTRVIRNEEKDEFQIAQAHACVKEAYMASNQAKYIILCGTTFRNEAQNALLKVLEEPPKNIIFIILTSSKSTILPTILSRMPHRYLKSKTTKEPCALDFKYFDLKECYLFLKEHQKIRKDEAKQIVESIFHKITLQKIKLSEKELESFSTALRLLEVNSRPINVLSTLLLTLLQRKK